MGPQGRSEDCNEYSSQHVFVEDKKFTIRFVFANCLIILIVLFYGSGWNKALLTKPMKFVFMSEGIFPSSPFKSIARGQK